AGLDLGAVVEARALVGPRELLQRVMPLRPAAVRLDHDLEYRRGVKRLQVLRVGDVDHGSSDVRDDHLAGVLGGVVLDARAHTWGVGDQQRHRLALHVGAHQGAAGDRKSTRLNSSHVSISYAVFCLKKKITKQLSALKTPGRILLTTSKQFSHFATTKIRSKTSNNSSNHALLPLSR